MAETRYLYLMRHGEAGACATDFDRPLTRGGKKQVKTETAQFKLPDGIRPDVIFCSTAKRTRQTAEELESLFRGIPVFYRETLYLAPPYRLLDLVRQTDEMFHRILVIGHNPGLEQLAGLLSKEMAYVSLKPADCVVINLEIESWKGLKPGVGKIEKIFRG